MKRSHIIGIGVIAIAVFVIIATAGDASTYVSFKEARELHASGSTKKVHVVGQLKKNDAGEVVGVEPGADKLSVSFLLVDNNNESDKVFYNQPMPPDLEKSEKVVVVGSFKEDAFYADQILLKCPSKYEEKTIKVTSSN